MSSLPSMRDVPSAFRLWEAGEKVPCWRPELVKYVAVREEVATESEAEHVSVPNQQEKSEPCSEKKTKLKLICKSKVKSHPKLHSPR